MAGWLRGGAQIAQGPLRERRSIATMSQRGVNITAADFHFERDQIVAQQVGDEVAAISRLQELFRDFHRACREARPSVSAGSSGSVVYTHMLPSSTPGRSSLLFGSGVHGAERFHGSLDVSGSRIIGRGIAMPRCDTCRCAKWGHVRRCRRMRSCIRSGMA